MKTNRLLKQFALMVLLVTIGVFKSLAATIFVNAPITSNTTWTNTNTYVLVGYIYVKNNSTLTIQPGTIIKGDLATLGSLIITTGSKIIAQGTACQPIIFTSGQPVGQRARGDWGGLILLGKAALNTATGTANIEGITPIPDTQYGGGANPDNNDNSGILQYVRIEFAGIALSPNNEINGLTFGAVGAGTTVDHIQVSYSNDDSYEWFGGTVNCKYLIAYDGIDDDFDSDNGFSGYVQFGLGMRDPNVADVSGSKSFESDNDVNGDANLPQTSAYFANFTALGGSVNNVANPLFKQSIHTRRNSNIRILNSIMMGFPQGILVDATTGVSTICNYATASEVQNCYVQQQTGNYFGFSPAGTDPCEPAATANLNSAGNVYATQYTGVLTNPDFPITSPNSMIPAIGNPLPAANNTLYAGKPLTPVAYVGAFNPAGDNWAGDWTEFDPVNRNYSNGIYAGNKVDATPKIAGTVTSSGCPNSGGVNITVTKGVAPFSYVWSNGATTEDLSGVAAGTYTVTVYDAGKNCSASKSFTVKTAKPVLTSCSSTSSSITVFRSASLPGVNSYELRFKKHSVATYGPWVNVGNGLSFTTTGLLSNTQYDFEIRGVCSSGKTGASKAITCATTLRIGETSNNASINAYPNPNTGEFTVELSGFDGNSTVSLQVVNMLGQVVYNNDKVSTDESTLKLNLGNVPSGLYNVEVTDGISHLVQNVMINK